MTKSEDSLFGPSACISNRTCADNSRTHPDECTGGSRLNASPAHDSVYFQTINVCPK